MNKFFNQIESSFLDHQKVTGLTLKKHNKNIFASSNILSNCIKNKGTVFWCGNGGSASDSLHLSAELIGRLNKNRRPLASISLSGNPSTLTCISNDFGYNKVFSRQIEALGKKNDVLVAISTSGNSLNILDAIKMAKKKKMKIISLLGKSGGKSKGLSNINIIIPSNSTARIQEMHILIGHIICDLTEKKLKL